MKKTALSLLLLSGVLLLCPSTGFAQNKTKILDEQAAQLKEQEPSGYTTDESYSTQWPTINEKDILWKKRVWRTITLSAKGNELLNAPALPHNLAETMLTGIQRGLYKAYSNKDERFSEELTMDQTAALMTDEKIGQVSSFQIKEDWLYLSNHKLVVRIIGIAPVIRDQPAFWVYYPSMRSYLATQTIRNAPASADNLDKLFETRRFAGKINRVAVPLL